MTQRLLSPSEVIKATPERERFVVVQRMWRESGEPDTLALIDEQPELLTERSLVLDLAFEEFTQRLERGDVPNVGDYVARFPAHRSSLFRMLSCFAFVEENGPGVAKAPAIVWPEPGSRLGDLTLVRELGRGSFARAYLAREATTGNRLVVAKLTRDGPREAQTLGPLNHPNIVPVLSAGQDPSTGLHMVRMPFLGQATFEDLIEYAFPRPDAPPTSARLILDVARSDDAVQDGEPASVLLKGSYEDGVVRLIGQLAGALAFLHARNVCHHDLKPTNVLLSPSGRPLLLDFNLSADGSLPPGRLGGTLRYMAAEQLQAMTERSPSLPGPAADVYALGVIARELLTGRHPFGPMPASGSVEDLSALLLDRQRIGTTPLAKLDTPLPRPLAGVLDRCLRPNPALRPTAQELADAADAYFRPAQRTRRWLSRHPRLVAAVGLVLLLATAGLAALAPIPRQREAQATELIERGMASFKSGATEDALDTFAEANRIHHDGRALACRAYVVALRKKNHDEAIDLYDQALDNPACKTARIYNNRGYSYLMSADDARKRKQDKEAGTWYERAHADFTEAIRLDGKLQAPFVNRAYLALRRRNSDSSWPMNEAREDIRTAVRLGPVTARLAMIAAEICAYASRQDEALEYLDTALTKGTQPEDIAADPAFNSLKNAPRFKELLKNKPGELITGELHLVEPLGTK